MEFTRFLKGNLKENIVVCLFFLLDMSWHLFDDSNNYETTHHIATTLDAQRKFTTFTLRMLHPTDSCKWYQIPI